MGGDTNSITSKMWVAVLLIASQSFLFGYVFSSLNTCLVTGPGNNPQACYTSDDNNGDGCPKGTIYNNLNLSTELSSVPQSLLVVGAWIGCLIQSFPSERYGRRVTLLGNSLVFLVGSGVSASGNLYGLFIGKFISGIAVGVISVLGPVLLSEIASAETRGTITTTHQLMVTLGIFIVSLVGYGFVTYVNQGWQYVQGLAGLPAILTILFKDYIPESPKWLIAQNRHQEAEAILTHIRPENSDIQAEVQDLDAENKKASKDDVTWSEVFSARKAVIVGSGLMAFQAFTGINSVIFYSTAIFGYAGFDQAILATTSVGVLNFGMTFVAVYFVDKFGRKILLSGGLYCMMVGLLLLSSILYAADSEPTVQGIIAVVAVLIFIAGFAIGLGAVVWVLMSEMMPDRLRVKAMSLFLSINWGANLIISLCTLTAIDGLGGAKTTMSDDERNAHEKKGVAYVYFIFMLVTIVCIAFVHLYVPETQGMTAEQLGAGESGASKFSSQANSIQPLLGDLEDSSETFVSGGNTKGIEQIRSAVNDGPSMNPLNKSSY